MTLVQGAANSAERSFHKTLATLAKLQKERGFVPQRTAQEQIAAGEEQQPAVEEPGFVPEKTAVELEAFEYFGHFPEDAEKYVESLFSEP